MKPYYEHNGIIIYHGDNADVLPLIAPKTVGLLLTDPPYGIDAPTAYAKAGRSRLAVAKDYKPVKGDDKPFDPTPLLKFGRCVLWGANNFASLLPGTNSWLVWDRLSGDSDCPDAELAWTNLGGTVRMFSHRWNGAIRDSESGYSVHPTQKPAALMRWIVNRWTKPGDLVLDPYMGSGPVAQACHELNRRYIGIESEESYCVEAVKRLNQSVLAF